MRPTATAATAPMIGPKGNGMWWASAIFDSVKPLMPARAICISEIWPTYPVSTTSERQITTPTSEFTMARRQSGEVRKSTTATATKATSEVGTAPRARGANGSLMVSTDPRVGSDFPRRTSTMMMITKGRAWVRPGIGWPPALGNQLWPERYWIQDESIPIPRPASIVTMNELNRPRSDAARAGTISRVIVIGSSDWLMAAARMPNMPASTVEATQFTPARKSGEYPRTIAPFSFSAAARVARPKRV